MRFVYFRTEWQNEPFHTNMTVSFRIVISLPAFLLLSISMPHFYVRVRKIKHFILKFPSALRSVQILVLFVAQKLTTVTQLVALFISLTERVRTIAYNFTMVVTPLTSEQVGYQEKNKHVVRLALVFWGTS